MGKNRLYKKRLNRFHCSNRYRKPHRGFYCTKHKSRRRKYNKLNLAWLQFERNVTLVLSQIFPKVNLDILQIFLKSPKGDVKKEIVNSEMGKIHKGFKKAQNTLVGLIVFVQAKRRKIKIDIKDSRNKEVRNILNRELQTYSYMLDVYKHLADTIFWQLIGGKLHLARRFFQDVPGEKDLVETNYLSVVEIAEEINSNPLNFVLLTDITNYVQLGDLVGIVDGKHEIIEVKEGKRNHEFLDDISFMLNSGAEQSQIKNVVWKYSNDPKSIKQMQRMLKQIGTTRAEMAIMNFDKGKDPVSGRNITIATPKIDTVYYNENLRKLEEQLKMRKRWAYDVIDGCLHVGVYRGKMRPIEPYIFDCLSKDIKHKYQIDARMGLKALGTPLFFWPFSKELIMDILMGRTLMLLMLDVDKFMELVGDTCQFASRKETAKATEMFKSKMLCIFDNQAIKYGENAFLCQGTIAKILFNQITPSYMAYALLHEYNS